MENPAAQPACSRLGSRSFIMFYIYAEPLPLQVGQVASGVQWQSAHSFSDSVPRHSLSHSQTPGIIFWPLHVGHTFCFLVFIAALLTC